MVSAQNVRRPSIDLIRLNMPPIIKESQSMPNEIQKSAPCGLKPGELEQVEKYTQTSSSSEKPSSSLKQRYRRPTDAKDLAAQASYVATQVLNGEVDLEAARIYSTLARTAAQGLGLEMQKSRSENKKAELTMTTDWQDT